MTEDNTDKEDIKNSSKDLKLIEKIKKERSYYVDSTESLRDVWDECWSLFNSEYKEADFPWRSQKFIPKVFQAVNSLAAFIVGKTPTITAYPRGEEDEAKAKEIAEIYGL